MADDAQPIEHGFDFLLGKIPTGLQGNSKEPNPTNPTNPTTTDNPPKPSGTSNSTNSSSTGGTTDNDDGDEDVLSDEQIQSKLTELEGKEETELTSEDKEFIEKYTKPNEDDSAIGVTKNYFKEKYGYTSEETKKYEDSPEGLSQFVDDVVPALVDSTIESYFNQVPLMGEFYKHVVLEGKSVNTFLAKSKEPEYKSIELKEVDDSNDEATNKKIVDNQKTLIRMNYTAKGIDSDMIDRIIELSELNGTLFTDASKSRDGLKATHTKAIQDQLAAEEKAKEAEEAQRVNIANQAKTILKANDFGGLSINPAHLKNFEKALFDVDGQGKSILDYKREKLTLAQRLYIDYLVLTDFKAQPYKKSPTQSKTFDFKSKAVQNDDRNGGRIRGGSGSGGGNGDGKINDLKDFFGNLVNQKQK